MAFANLTAVLAQSIDSTNNNETPEILHMNENQESNSKSTASGIEVVHFFLLSCCLPLCRIVSALGTQRKAVHMLG